MPSSLLYLLTGVKAMAFATLLPGLLNAQNFTQNSKRYANKFSYEALGQETIIHTWYHYVTSRTEDGAYVARIFHPDLGQLTSRTHYLDAQFTVKHGTEHLWWDNGDPRSVGRYEQNVKAGFWVYWGTDMAHHEEGNESANGKQGIWTVWSTETRKSMEVTYVNNVRHGPFVTFDSLGVEHSRGRYEKGVLIETEGGAKPEEVVEQMPAWGGCREAGDAGAIYRCQQEGLYRFLGQNIRYPKKAMDMGIQGQAIIGFTLDPEGRIKDIEALSGLSNEITAECIRVIEQMPPWEPGYQRGKAVNVRFNLPVKFTIR